MATSDVHIIPVGTSEPQEFDLVSDGAEVDGTDMAIAIEASFFVDGEATPVSPALTVSWLSPAAGRVRVTGVEDLAVGTYLVRFKLTDSGAEIGFVPNGEKAYVWKVVPIANR